MALPQQDSLKNYFVSPYITVTNVDAAVDFYKKAFGFKYLESKPGEDGTTWHAEMTYKDQLIMFGKEAAYGCPLKSPLTSKIDSPITLCLYSDDVDEFYKTALSKGAKSLSAPENMEWGHRMCRVQDLDNYTWCVVTPLSE